MTTSDVENQRPQLSPDQIDALLDNLKVVESLKQQIDRITVELAVVRSQQQDLQESTKSGKEDCSAPFITTGLKTNESAFNASRRAMFKNLSAGSNRVRESDIEAFYDAVDEVHTDADAGESDNASIISISPRGRPRYSSVYQTGFAGIQYAKSAFMGRSLEVEDSGELEQDLFTMMMVFPPLVAIRSIHRSARLEGESTERTFYPCCRMSKVWMLGILAFVVEMTLGTMVVMDQMLDIPILRACGFWNFLTGAEECAGIRALAWTPGNPFGMALQPNPFVQIAQGMTIPLAVISQTDIATSMRTLYQLRHSDSCNWHEVIGIDQNHRTPWAWFVRIFVPNFFKFTEAAVILFASWLIIVQSDNIVDLLKDFSALMVISTVDNVLFIMAENGFFGTDLLNATKHLKGIKVDNSAFDKGIGRAFKAAGIAILSTLMVSWGVLAYKQTNGDYFVAEYPDCSKESVFGGSLIEGRPNFLFYKNNFCNGFLNKVECGMDGGDCEDHNAKYPGCFANFTGYLGNGYCDDDGFYNTYACAWDLGDCVFQNYPKCNLTNETAKLLGNKQCDLEYNTTECGYDGRDCA